MRLWHGETIIHVSCVLASLGHITHITRHEHTNTHHRRHRLTDGWACASPTAATDRTRPIAKCSAKFTTPLETGIKFLSSRLRVQNVPAKTLTPPPSPVLPSCYGRS